MEDGEEVAKTGDDNNLILWVGIGILAIVIIFILNKKLSNK
ncbi:MULTISPECIES: LPXTG cell wall anchor domain-containing protein [Terrisporobacter]|uniref:LPXTG cell wall anchor domain-containing protein n=1 Tax=Terrisporobacter muris TaxID=2963284 RepID=A0A9X2MDU7_9FIRM|nr:MULTISPECIES: LPXTG cell wall anchor domain-containing protein [Terrisporobacter]MCR1824348.1 LPXTG cell wall anchor domain-containing protein [Terrisporobacter muris]MDU6984609.1 LPXTG cell wall anchor domain-containing protein [Terrisporobacter othiniensis]